MKNLNFNLLILSLLISVQSWAREQEEIVGVQPLVSAVSEVALVPKGWSAKKSILGHDVYNETNEKVGRVEDLVISPETSISFAIISVSRFLGFSTHDVAVPVKLFSFNDKGELVLKGANEQALKDLPGFHYK